MPWGGDAPAVTLSPGLNAFLVPREQFLASPFGQAILLGKNTSYNGSRGVPPLIGSSEEGLISGFGGANYMIDLAAYWQNRAVNSGTNVGTITPSTETGTPYTSSLNVNMTVVTSPPSNNTGVVPTTPGLYNVSDPAPPAMQSIFTLNVTSEATLDLLLAALIDNTSGGANAVNGTLQAVTFEVPSLNLERVVGNALPNETQSSDGLYGPYTGGYRGPSNNLWGDFWNAATSVIENPLGAILSLATVGWNAATAAYDYANHLVHEVDELGGDIISRVAAALDYVGGLILQALEVVEGWITALFRAAVNAAFIPIWSACTSYATTLFGATGMAYADLEANGTVPSRDASRFWSDFGGAVFLVSLAIAIAVEIGLALVMGFSLGAGFVIGILLSIILTSLMSRYVSEISISNPSENGYTQAASSMVWSVMEITNYTKVNGSLPADKSASNYTPTWTSAAEVYGWGWSLFSTQYASYALLAAFGDKSGVYSAAAALGTLVVALILSLVLLQVHTLAAFVTTAAVGRAKHRP